MTIYYVRRTGQDDNDGRTRATAWRTLTHAVDVAEAGDTVYVGAGLYRDRLVLPRSGTRDAPIKYIGDTSGYYTGDPGLVLIAIGTDCWITSAYPEDPPPSVVGRNSLLDLAGQTYVEFHRLAFLGDVYPGVRYEPGSPSSWCGEGVVFADCNFGVSGFAFETEGPRASITAPGLTLRRCITIGEGYAYFGGADASFDANLRIEQMLALTGITVETDYPHLLTNSAFVGGFDCLPGSWGSYCGTNTVINNVCAWARSYHENARSTVNALGAWGERVNELFTWLQVGGITDLQFRQYFGVSPYAPFTPYWDSALGVRAAPVALAGAETPLDSALPATDFYGNPIASSSGIRTTWISGSITPLSTDNGAWTQRNPAPPDFATLDAYYFYETTQPGAVLKARGIYNGPAGVCGDPKPDGTVYVSVVVAGTVQIKVLSRDLNVLSATLSGLSPVTSDFQPVKTLPLATPPDGWTLDALIDLSFEITNTGGSACAVSPVFVHAEVANAVAYGICAARPVAQPDGTRMKLNSQGVFRIVRILPEGTYHAGVNALYDSGYTLPDLPRLTVDLPTIGLRYECAMTVGPGQVERLDIEFSVPACTLMIATVENRNTQGWAEVWFEDFTVIKV